MNVFFFQGDPVQCSPAHDTPKRGGIFHKSIQTSRKESNLKVLLCESNVQHVILGLIISKLLEVPRLLVNGEKASFVVRNIDTFLCSS